MRKNNTVEIKSDDVINGEVTTGEKENVELKVKSATNCTENQDKQGEY